MSLSLFRSISGSLEEEALKHSRPWELGNVAFATNERRPDTQNPKQRSRM